MTTMQDRWFHAKRRVREFMEDQWFDHTRRVHTSGDMPLSKAGIAAEDQADSELYVPARPADIRAALRAAPMQDAARYTFVDIGSGKGRTLFVAAELPFKRLVGVEFSERMHAQACRNVASYRYRGQKGSRVQPVHGNAMHFAFPPGPLVLYLFNPFGRSTMQVVLRRLEHSLESDPRHTLVILLWPRCGDLVQQVPGMHCICSTERHQIFEAYR